MSAVDGYASLVCWGATCVVVAMVFAVFAFGIHRLNRSQHDVARNALIGRGALFVERVRYRGTAFLAIRWGIVDVAIDASGLYMGAPRSILGGGPFVRYVGPRTTAPGVGGTWGTRRVEQVRLEGDDLCLIVGTGFFSSRLRLRRLPPAAREAALSVLGDA